MRKAAEIASAFAPREALDGKLSFFLVGIGGAGMSALARMLKHRGFSVRGTDSTLSPEVERLRSEGFEVAVGHSGEGIRADDAVVLTDAIDLDNSPEVKRAKELGIPLFRRSQALGWLLKPYKVIAVTGTHGKTTTTGMIGSALKEAGLDPTIVVGASVPQFGGPVVEGAGEWAVVEACEAYDAFHDIDPWYVVLTNLELDHVDFHGNWENLKESVKRFVSRSSRLFYAEEDKGAAEIAAEVDVMADGYDLRHWSALLEGTDILIATPKQAGRHNLLNACGALMVAEAIGADLKRACLGIISFRGAERRQQILRGEGARFSWDESGFSGPKDCIPTIDLTVIDDYAHHPTEIRESLRAIRGARLPGNYPEVIEFQKEHGVESTPGRLIVVFQPHLYSRTADNIPEFAKALDEADVVFLTDIYPAREEPIPGVSSARIAELITKECHYVPSRHLLPRTVAAFAREGDVVVGMGAGTISEFGPAFIKEWERKMRNIGFQPILSEGILPSDSEERSQDGYVGHPEDRDATLEADATTIAVIYGGDSSEREVSLHSGREVYRSLIKQGFKAELVDVTELLLSKGDLSRFAGTSRPDLAFLAVHGTNSEDGAVQGLFELLHMPYTGSGVQASAKAMDKDLTKQILSANGVRVPNGRLVRSLDEAKNIQAPVVVKPNAEGSTVGLSFVETQDQLEQAIRKALTYGGACLVEEWVKGMEISVPVLGDRALLPVEIAPASGFYDFASKYTPGATEEIVPARLPEDVLKQVQEIALKAHNLLGCQGATRTDMMISQTGNTPYVLEVNTLPGMTSTSLLPNSAKAAGIDFDALVLWLVEDALQRYAAKA